MIGRDRTLANFGVQSTPVISVGKASSSSYNAVSSCADDNAFDIAIADTMGSKASKANGSHHRSGGANVVQVATMNGTHKNGIESANSPNQQRPKAGKVSNGQAVLLRRDTPAGGLLENQQSQQAPSTTNNNG